MALNEFQRTSYKMLGGLIARSVDLNKLESDIKKARLGVRAEAYMATTLAVSAITALFGIALGAFAFLFVVPKVAPTVPVIARTLGVFLVPLLLFLISYVTMMSTPGSKAKGRAKNIDQRIPYALNYIAAMASAGVNIDQVFRSLGEQEIYGECAREAQFIYRDMAYFGRDSVTAMKRGIDRTPSEKQAEFLQGAITTVTSGGDLQQYFSSKAQRYMWENRQVQKQFVDMMGLMAETYVTTAVAGPLFLIVMMSIMGMLGGEGPSSLYLVVYIMLPVVNAGFTFALSSMTPEV